MPSFNAMLPAVVPCSATTVSHLATRYRRNCARPPAGVRSRVRRNPASSRGRPTSRRACRALGQLAELPIANMSSRPRIVRATYLEAPFSGQRARHEALDYFAGYAAVTGPTVVIPDQRTAITIRPRHHGLVGHVCPDAIKPESELRNVVLVAAWPFEFLHSQAQEP